MDVLSPYGGSTNEYGVIVNDWTLAYVFNWYFITCLWEVLETVYTDRPDEPPFTYADLRQCIRDIEPLLEDGLTIEATIRGFDTETGREVTKRGTVVDLTYAGVSMDDDQSAPLSQLAGETSLTLETDDGTYTVGGWARSSRTSRRCGLRSRRSIDTDYCRDVPVRPPSGLRSHRN